MMKNKPPAKAVPDTGTTSVPAVTSANVSDAQQVVDSTAVATPADPATPTSEPEIPHTGKNRAEERIQDLVAERNAAKEYAEYWREQAIRGIRAPEQQPQRASEPRQVAPTSPPTLEQFGYDQ